MINVVADSAGQGADTLVQLIVAMAGSGVVVAVIQGVFTRHKTKAEVESTGANATKLITDAAASVVDRVQADNATLRAEVAALRAEVATLGRWRSAAEDNFERHEEWDVEVATQLRERLVPVEDPPSLRPHVPYGST